MTDETSIRQTPKSNSQSVALGLIGCLLALFCFKMAGGINSNIQNFIHLDLNIDPREVQGQINPIGTIVAIIAAPLFGLLADRWGKWKVMAIGVGLGTLSFFFIALKNIALFKISLITLQLADASILGIIFAIVFGVIANRTWFGIAAVLVPVINNFATMISSSILMGYFVRQSFDNGEQGNFTTTLLWMQFLIMLVGGGIGIILLYYSGRKPIYTFPEAHNFAPLRFRLRGIGISILFLVRLVVITIPLLLIIYIPFLLEKEASQSNLQIAAFYMNTNWQMTMIITAILAGIFADLLDSLTERHLGLHLGRAAILVAGGVVVVISLVLLREFDFGNFIDAGGIPVLISRLTLLQAGGVIIMVALVALVMGAVSPRWWATVSGGLYSLTASSTILAQILGGAVVETNGWQMLTNIALILGGIVLFLILVVFGLHSFKNKTLHVP